MRSELLIMRDAVAALLAAFGWRRAGRALDLLSCIQAPCKTRSQPFTTLYIIHCTLISITINYSCTGVMSYNRVRARLETLRVTTSASPPKPPMQRSCLKPDAIATHSFRTYLTKAIHKSHCVSDRTQRHLSSRNQVALSQSQGCICDERSLR